jgi:hypothetical protein
MRVSSSNGRAERGAFHSVPVFDDSGWSNFRSISISRLYVAMRSLRPRPGLDLTAAGVGRLDTDQRRGVKPL